MSPTTHCLPALALGHRHSPGDTTCQTVSTAEALPYSWEGPNHYLPFLVPVYIKKPGGVIF